MNLSEPDTPAVVTRVPAPEDFATPDVTATLVTASWEGDAVHVVRLPAAVAFCGEQTPQRAHLAVDEREPEERLVELGDVLFCRVPRLDQPAEDWLSETMGRYPGCHLAAAEHLPGESLVRLRDGTTVRISGGPAELHASLVYAWTGRGRHPSQLPAECTVLLGSAAHHLSIKSDR
jgi:hypothetical protein